jgi:LuxR family transcriptional regulator, activator of tox operons
MSSFANPQALGPLGAAIKAIGTREFEPALHAAVNHIAETQHMTVMTYPDRGAPSALLVSSPRSKALIEALTNDYVRRYYRDDPHRAAILCLRPTAETTVLRRRSCDFDEQYRRHFFSSSEVADKISIAWRSEDSWHAINLYASFDHGCYSETELNIVARLAPVLAGAVSRHAEFGTGERPDTLALARRIAAARNVRLSARELEVAAGILEGKHAGAIAQELGIAPSSVHTFRKLLYRKLTIGSQGELFSIALSLAPKLKGRSWQ